MRVNCAEEEFNQQFDTDKGCFYNSYHLATWRGEGLHPGRGGGCNDSAPVFMGRNYAIIWPPPEGFHLEDSPVHQRRYMTSHTSTLLSRFIVRNCFRNWVNFFKWNRFLAGPACLVCDVFG